MRPATRLLLAAVALALVGGCDRKKAAAPQQTAGAPMPETPPAEPIGGVDRTHKGEAAPAIPFSRPDGAPATLAAFRGKPLLVNLWATWCSPCVRELPLLDRVAASHPDLQVVTVSQDSHGAAVVAPYLAKRGLTHLPGYYDAKNVLLTAFNADNLPSTILFDAHGREVWRIQGDLDWQGALATKLLAEATG